MRFNQMQRQLLHLLQQQQIHLFQIQPLSFHLFSRRHFRQVFVFVDVGFEFRKGEEVVVFFEDVVGGRGCPWLRLLPVSRFFR
jgi:hypothetical protein